MTRQDMQRHALVLAATLSGIVGMGMMFDAAVRWDVHGMSRAAPLLLLGLWWAGRELGRSMIAARSRRDAMPTGVTPTSGPPRR